jgi:hypothetical protein
MNTIMRRAWRIIIDVSNLLRAGIAFLDYYDRHDK